MPSAWGRNAAPKWARWAPAERPESSDYSASSACCGCFTAWTPRDGAPAEALRQDDAGRTKQDLQRAS